MLCELFHEKNGDPRARGAEGFESLAGFLESDLQGSAEAAREVVRAIAQVRSGESGSWERIGNAYRLSLTADAATIEPLYGIAEKPCALSVEDLCAVVEDWIELIDRTRGG